MLISPDAACAVIEQSLDFYLSNELAEVCKKRVRQHLIKCPACAARAEERMHVKRLLQRAVRCETAPASLKRSIQEIIRKN